MPYTNQISNYGSFKYVVTGPNPGPFHTIQETLDYVLSQGETTTILLQPGTYTENLTLYTGINIQGSEEGQVIIVGTHTPPAAGTFTISQCTLQSATDIFNSAAAGTTAISISNCIFNLTAGYVFNITNWTGDLSIDNCSDISADNHIIVNTAAAALDIKDSAIGAGITTLAASGITRIFNSRIFCPATFSLASDVLIDGGSRIDAGLFTLNTSTVSIFDTVISSGAATGITHNSTNLLTLSNVTIDSSAGTVIDGTGTASLGEVVYPNSNTIAGTIVYNNSSELQCSNLIVNNDALITTGDVTIGTGRLFLGISSGTNGQIPIATTGASPAWANLTAGSGVSITNGAGSVSIASTAPMTWSVMSADAGLAVNTARINTKAGALLTATLPATAAVGTVIILQGSAAGNTGWLIAQNAGQNIQLGNTSTTIGVGGSLASTDDNDSVSLVCTVADTTWNAFSVIGNITVV